VATSWPNRLAAAKKGDKKKKRQKERESDRRRADAGINLSAGVNSAGTSNAMMMGAHLYHNSGVKDRVDIRGGRAGATAERGRWNFSPEQLQTTIAAHDRLPAAAGDLTDLLTRSSSLRSDGKETSACATPDTSKSAGGRTSVQRAALCPATPNQERIPWCLRMRRRHSITGTVAPQRHSRLCHSVPVDRRRTIAEISEDLRRARHSMRHLDHSTPCTRRFRRSSIQTVPSASQRFLDRGWSG